MPTPSSPASPRRPTRSRSRASGGAELTEALDSDSDAEVRSASCRATAGSRSRRRRSGRSIRNALDGAGVHDEAAAQVQQNVGLDLDRDLLEPLGGLGVFARGESPLDIGGGALLQMTDAAAAQRLLTRIQAIVGAGLNAPTRPLAVSGARGFQVQIPQSPQPIVVLAKGDRLAAGYAASSAQDLLEPQQRFDESSDGKAAIDTLGDGYTPSFVLIVPPLAGLAESARSAAGRRSLLRAPVRGRVPLARDRHEARRRPHVGADRRRAALSACVAASAWEACCCCWRSPRSRPGAAASRSGSTARRSAAPATSRTRRSSSASPPSPRKNTTRVGGADAIADAAAVARAVYPGRRDRRAGGASACRRARRPAACGRPDSAAAVLMSDPLRAPLLLSDGGELPAASADALAALAPTGASELGGAQVVRVGDAPAPGGYRSTTIAGDDPSALAAAIDRLQSAAVGRASRAVVRRLSRRARVRDAGRRLGGEDGQPAAVRHTDRRSPARRSPRSAGAPQTAHLPARAAERGRHEASSRRSRGIGTRHAHLGARPGRDRDRVRAAARRAGRLGRRRPRPRPRVRERRTARSTRPPRRRCRRAARTARCC